MKYSNRQFGSVCASNSKGWLQTGVKACWDNTDHRA